MALNVGTDTNVQWATAQGKRMLHLPRCRSDRGIDTAQRRAAWAKGHEATFHPYGRTQARVFAEQD